MLTNEEGSGIITKLSHGEQNKKSWEAAWEADFGAESGLDWNRLTEKTSKKSFKKLLTNAWKCDMINKSSRESESSWEMTRTLKIKQRKDKQEPVITLRSMYFSKFYNNAQALELVFEP